MKKIICCLVISVFSVFLCGTVGAQTWTADDVDINLSAEIPDTILDKCVELGKADKSFLVAKAKTDGQNYGHLYNGYSSSVYTVTDDYYIFISDDNIFCQTDNPVGWLNFTSVEHFDSNGAYIGQDINQDTCQYFNVNNFTLLSCNKGLYSYDNHLLMRSTSLPMRQAVKAHYTTILTEILSVFGICLTCLVAFIGLRKGIAYLFSFLRGV